MPTLSDITNKLTAILDRLQEEAESPEQQDGETISDLLNALETQEKLRNEKIDNIIFVITEFHALAEAKKQIADQYRQQAQAYQNKAKSLKQYLQYWLSGKPDTEIKTGKHCLRLTRNSQASLVLTGDVPLEYTRQIIEPDTALIREVLEGEVSLPFAHLERGVHLRIK